MVFLMFALSTAVDILLCNNLVEVNTSLVATVLWVDIHPPKKRYVEVLTSSTSECHFIGNKIVADVIN